MGYAAPVRLEGYAAPVRLEGYAAPVRLEGYAAPVRLAWVLPAAAAFRGLAPALLRGARPSGCFAPRVGRLGGSVFGGRRRPAFSRRDYFLCVVLRGLSSGAASAARAPAPPLAGAAAPRLPLLLSPFFPSSLRAGRRAR